MLSKNLEQWREDRNITTPDYKVFFENIIEELLEPIYGKSIVKQFKNEIVAKYYMEPFGLDEYEMIDAIQDIKVFCNNETALMGYDNEKCELEVFKEINSRKQCPIQKELWEEAYPVGKWEKDKNQDESTLYKADYSSCKIA